MLNHKTWDDYLTESSSAKETAPLVQDSANTRPKNGNPFRTADDITADAERFDPDRSYNALSSEIPDTTAGNERDDITEMTENRNAENTLNSLDSIDIYPFAGEAKSRPSRERLFLFEGDDGAPTASQNPLKDIFDNGIREDVKSSRLFSYEVKQKIRNELKRPKGFSEPKVFGGNFKYMRGYLRSALPLGNDEKENICSTTNAEGSIPNEVIMDSTVVKLQQEVKSCRRKIERLREMNMTCVRRKEELQEEVLSAHKEITDLKIALQTSCDKQHEFEIEMRIAKARVDEAEREAAIAIGNTNKLERELEEMNQKQQSNTEKLTTSEHKMSTLNAELSNSKERCREEVQAKHEYQQIAETRNYELKTCVKEIESVKTKVKEMEDERTSMLQNLDHALQEKARCEGKIEELMKSNHSMKEDYMKIQQLHEICKQNVEIGHKRVEEQKLKFEAMVASRVNIETEIKEMHEELDRQKNEKDRLASENHRLLERLNEREATTESMKKENEQMKNESSNMRDKILYLELYKKVIDTKTLSLDELKPLHSQILHQVSSQQLCDQNAAEVSSKQENEKTTVHSKIQRAPKSMLDIDIKNITKKLEEIKEEHRLIHGDTERPTPITSPSQGSSNAQHTPPSLNSPFNSNKIELSIVPPSFLMNGTQEDALNFHCRDEEHCIK